MTAITAQVPPARARRIPLGAPARLLRLELRRLTGQLTYPEAMQPSAGLDRPSPKAFQPGGGAVRHGDHPAGVVRAGLRLVRLHLASRRVVTCLLILIAGAVVLRVALPWLPRTGGSE